MDDLSLATKLLDMNFFDPPFCNRPAFTAANLAVDSAAAFRPRLVSDNDRRKRELLVELGGASIDLPTAPAAF